jgi:hypothetical protein
MNSDPETDAFDWVTQRSECSLPKVYQKLKMEVEGNVTTRNVLRSHGEHYTFTFVSGNGRFSVITEASKVHKAVDFILSEKCIEVSSEGSVMFQATVGINDDGECVLFVNREERKRWQVIKLALDQLFFEVF